MIFFGNTAWADMAGLGSIGFNYCDEWSIHVRIRRCLDVVCWSRINVFLRSLQDVVTTS